MRWRSGTSVVSFSSDFLKKFSEIVVFTPFVMKIVLLDTRETLPIHVACSYFTELVFHKTATKALALQSSQLIHVAYFVNRR